MDRRFLRGLFIGGALGVAMATKWEILQKICPFLAEINGHMLFDKSGQPACRSDYNSAHLPKTRLMARRNKMKQFN